VAGKKPRTVNSKKRQSSVSSSLTAAGTAMTQQTECIPSYSREPMDINKQNDTKTRRKGQRSSNNTEENGNHTEETQCGPPQIPPNIGAKQENVKNGIN
jgi:hypothetical protein